MNAVILSIGDELVLGQTVDTNSAWLSAQLAAVGVAVRAHVTVPDDQHAIEDAIQYGAAGADLLLISGGLGPTQDDLTRQAMAAVMGVRLEMNAIALAQLTAFFHRIKRPMVESNKIQAMIPRGAVMIENTCGTAPGIDATLRKGGDRPCRIFVMPGVPREMKEMFTRYVLPRVQSASGGAVIVSRTLHTFGSGESTVGEMLGQLMERRRNPSVGTTVSEGIVSIRINSSFDSRARALEEMEKTSDACRRALGDLVYGQDGQTLPEVIAGMIEQRQPFPQIATAESCTGGLLAKMITDVPGSSRYFQRGWVCYANQAKHELLGVPLELLEQHGAVSEPVAIAMAAGARQRAGADYALAITGVAGPDGGTAAKPVGMVCLALASADGTAVRTVNFTGDRELVRDRSAKMALTMLRFQLMGKALPI